MAVLTQATAAAAELKLEYDCALDEACIMAGKLADSQRANEELQQRVDSMELRLQQQQQHTLDETSRLEDELCQLKTAVGAKTEAERVCERALLVPAAAAALSHSSFF